MKKKNRIDLLRRVLRAGNRPDVDELLRAELDLFGIRLLKKGCDRLKYQATAARLDQIEEAVGTNGPRRDGTDVGIGSYRPSAQQSAPR